MFSSEYKLYTFNNDTKFQINPYELRVYIQAPSNEEYMNVRKYLITNYPYTGAYKFINF